MTPEPFKLQPPPKPYVKPKFESNPAKPKAVLFAGADCLAGQGELFCPDGPKEKGGLQ